MRARTASVTLSMLVLSAAFAVAAPVAADPHEKPAPTPMPTPGSAPAPGFVFDLLSDFGGAARRLVQLAEAMPADKYGWRPAEGVRSFAEVLMHVAAGNYFAASGLGMPPPAGVDPMKLESITDPAEALATLRSSIAHFHNAAAAVDPATLDEEVALFDDRYSKRRLMLLMQGHAHEHTGQAIAYARMNGVAPPWSRGGDGG